MNNIKRANMVKAMDTIVTNLNDEELLDAWLMNGVADGDIDYDTPLEEVDSCYYEKDKDFADLMALFMRMMRYALEDEELEETDRKKGNEILYCDKVVSKKEEY